MVQATDPIQENPAMPPIKDLLDVLLGAVLPALAVAAMVMAAVERLGDAKQAPAGAILGLIAGVALGWWLRNVLPFVPGDSAWNRLPWAGLIAFAIGRVAYLADVHSSDGWLLRGLTALGLAWWVVPEQARHELVWLAPALAAAIWANWMLLDLLATVPGSSSVAATIALSLLVAAVVLLQAGIARYMEAMLVVTAAFAGIAVVAYLRRLEIGAVVPAIAVALPGMLMMGQTQSSVTEIHWSAFALPALAPLMLAAALPFSHWPKIRVHYLRIGLVLVPLVAATILALQAGPPDFGQPEW